MILIPTDFFDFHSSEIFLEYSSEHVILNGGTLRSSFHRKTSFISDISVSFICCRSRAIYLHV